MPNWYPCASSSIHGLDPNAPPRGNLSKALSKSTSLPSLGSSAPKLSKSNPLAKPQPLVHMEVGKRRIVRHSVGGIERNGKGVRVLEDVKFGFCAFERGLEWERPGAKAQLPKAKLPELHEVLSGIQTDFNIEEIRASIKLKAEFKPRVAFGGAPRYLAGPRLPIKRPRHTLFYAPDQPQTSFPSSYSMYELEPETPTSEYKPLSGPCSEPADSPTQGDKKQEMAQPVEEEPAPAPVEEEEEVLPFPWTDDELHGTFSKFDTDRDGEVDKEELKAALEYLGLRPSQDEVMRLAAEQTAFATLSFEEFNEFLHRYREHDVAIMRAEFNAFDVDGGGSLDFEELNELIQKLGYASTRQVVQEAMNLLDTDGGGSLNFREFEALREHLRRCEGFMKNDLDEITELYDKGIATKLDEFGQPADELGTEDCWRITMFLGFSASEKDVAEIASEVDADGSGQVNIIELLKIVRKVREAEMDCIKAVMATHGDDPEKLPLEDLGSALSELGYFVAEEAVFEILDSIGETVCEDTLSPEELSAFLLAYRRIEGFLKEEIAELKDVFERETGGGDSLGTLEIGRVLRWFGFSKTIQEVQRLVDEVDFDVSGKLEFGEYVKLMRRIYQAEAMKRHNIFTHFDSNRKNEVHKDYLARMIEKLQGVKADDAIFEQALVKPPPEEGEEEEEEDEETKNSPFIDRREWEFFCKRYRELVVKQVRAAGGYTPLEVEHMQVLFNEFDADGSGAIEAKELRQLIAAYFPEASKSKAGQKVLQDMLGEIDDGNMEIEFKEFLWLMRRCDDMRDERDIRMEVEVVKDCALPGEDVEGYRQIFSSNVDWKGDMNLDNLFVLLSGILAGEMTGDQGEELMQLVRDVHPEGREVCRFPQFLKLIKRITEDNALGLNDAATRVVRREEKNKAGAKR